MTSIANLERGRGEDVLAWRIMVATVFTALLIGAPIEVGAIGTPIPRDPSGYCADQDQIAMLGLINGLRASVHATPLQLDQSFGAAAQYHVESMSQHRYMAHDVLPENKSWWDIAQEFGATSQWHGENIAWGNADAKSTFDQWTSDQIHYDNLVDPHYTVIGIGRVTGPTPDPKFSGTTTIWAVTFGDHLDQAAVPCSARTATPVGVSLSDAPTPMSTALSDAPTFAPAQASPTATAP